MLRKEVIKRATTEWASLITLFADKDGSLLFSVNSGALKALIVNMDEFICSLGETTIFSTVDASSGYWTIGIGELAKISHLQLTHELYIFKEMQLAIKNEPMIF